MKSKLLAWTPLTTLLLSTAACTTTPTTNGIEADETSCKVKGTKTDPSLIVTDATVLALAQRGEILARF